MTFKEVWESLVKKDDRLNDPESRVEFKAGNLKKLLQQVYDKGFDQSGAAHSAIDKLMGGLGRR